MRDGTSLNRPKTRESMGFCFHLVSFVLRGVDYRGSSMSAFDKAKGDFFFILVTLALIHAC